MSYSSLLLPTIYLGGVVVAMSAFSFVYRRSQTVSQSDPWFGTNEAREQYIALLSAEDPVPELHLKAALLRRAMEAVRRMSQLQAEKPALQQLMRQGAVGDDLWQHFQVAEQQEVADLQEIVAEANTYAPGWGQYVLQNAAQMVEHQKLKDLKEEMKKVKEKEEKEAKRREEKEKIEEEKEKARKEKEREKALEELLKEDEKKKKTKKK